MAGLDEFSELVALAAPPAAPRRRGRPQRPRQDLPAPDAADDVAAAAAVDPDLAMVADLMIRPPPKKHEHHSWQLSWFTQHAPTSPSLSRIKQTQKNY